MKYRKATAEIIYFDSEAFMTGSTAQRWCDSYGETDFVDGYFKSHTCYSVTSTGIYNLEIDAYIFTCLDVWPALAPGYTSIPCRIYSFGPGYVT